MTSTILALASLMLSGYIALAMKMPKLAEDSSSLGNLLNRRQSLLSGNAMSAYRQRRSPHQDETPIANSKYRAPKGQQYEGVEGRNNQLARGPYYGHAGSVQSPDGDQIPLKNERSFDSLGGGELPWVDRRSKAAAGDWRIQERAFDTLGGGEIPWIGGRSLDKRGQQRK